MQPWLVKKQLIVTYSKCVFAVLGNQYAAHMRNIFMCDLSGSTIFFHIISQTTR